MATSSAEAQDLRSRAVVASKTPFRTECEAGKTYYWCTCGHSKNQPFCDGSHVAVNQQQNLNFAPLAFTPQETGVVLLCGCKKTNTPPYCDFTHIKVCCCPCCMSS